MSGHAATISNGDGCVTEAKEERVEDEVEAEDEDALLDTLDAEGRFWDRIVLWYSSVLSPSCIKWRNQWIPNSYEQYVHCDGWPAHLGFVNDYVIK